MRILQFLSDTVSFELGFLETIGNFVICKSKKLLILTEILLKNINKDPAKSLKRALMRKLIPAKSLIKLNSQKFNSREILSKAQFAKIDSREMSEKKIREN